MQYNIMYIVYIGTYIGMHKLYIGIQKLYIGIYVKCQKIPLNRKLRRWS